MEETAFRFGR